MQYIHNNGPEFMGAPCILMLELNDGIKDVPMTVKNPQADARNM